MTKLPYAYSDSGKHILQFVDEGDESGVIDIDAALDSVLRMVSVLATHAFKLPDDIATSLCLMTGAHRSCIDVPGQADESLFAHKYNDL